MEERAPVMRGQETVKRVGDNTILLSLSIARGFIGRMTKGTTADDLTGGWRKSVAGDALREWRRTGCVYICVLYHIYASGCVMRCTVVRCVSDS